MSDTHGAATSTLDQPVLSRDTLVEATRSDVRSLRPGNRRGNILADRYQLLGVLGRGGSGEVYEARDLDTGATVAVKVMRDHRRGASEALARFECEIHTLCQIDHTAVVRVLDSGREADGSFFMVMERLRGEVLFQRMRRPMDADEITDIGIQLLGALHFTHKLGIVHRDIKPENLFLAEAPQKGELRLKILDFGIAKLLTPTARLPFQTMDGLILGTPEYMSPEVCRGHAITPAADLWSVGAVLFHMVMGEPPFQDASVGRLLLKIVRTQAPSLAALRPDLPAKLTCTVDRALSPERHLRFPSAYEFLRALGGRPSVDLCDPPLPL